MQPRYRDWAEQLLKAGKAVLLPDSYGSRELGPQCRVRERRMLARRERVADIMASRQWLVQQPWVARDRISLMGWANGASALLWAVRPQSPRASVEPDFRSAIAFYPDCRISSGLGWSARVPTLLLIGARDDISSPPACRQMVDGARGRSALARIVVYPGAAARFRSRQSSAAGDRWRRPIPHCRNAAISAPIRSARGFAEARRGMAGEVMGRLVIAWRGESRREGWRRLTLAAALEITLPSRSASRCDRPG